MPLKEIKNRDKLILTGLYLSKFDKSGLERLGFSSFSEAFNVLGYALEGKPASIKNYRDEFDPYFDNPRHGWHNRALRDYCKAIMDSASDYSFDYFSNVVASFIDKDFLLKNEIDDILHKKNESAFINRISTGLAAENFFIKNYTTHFKDFSLSDTRQFGCGFDFKIDSPDDFFCVEVKGLKSNSGNFLMTQKEFEVAESLREKYCLYIVRNFQEKPYESLFFNPLEKFNLVEKRQNIVQRSYQGSV